MQFDISRRPPIIIIFASHYSHNPHTAITKNDPLAQSFLAAELDEAAGADVEVVVGVDDKDASEDAAEGDVVGEVKFELVVVIVVVLSALELVVVVTEVVVEVE